MTSSGHAHRQRYDMAYRVSHERALNVAKKSKYVSCTARTSHGNDFELILTNLTLKMKLAITLPVRTLHSDKRVSNFLPDVDLSRKIVLLSPLLSNRIEQRQLARHLAAVLPEHY